MCIDSGLTVAGIFVCVCLCCVRRVFPFFWTENGVTVEHKGLFATLCLLLSVSWLYLSTVFQLPVDVMW